MGPAEKLAAEVLVCPRCGNTLNGELCSWRPATATLVAPAREVVEGPQVRWDCRSCGYGELRSDIAP